jgi:hypothetical protein
MHSSLTFGDDRWQPFRSRSGFGNLCAEPPRLVRQETGGAKSMNRTYESSFGRFFEVTKEGEIVWEYVNPFLASPSLAAHLPRRAIRCSGRSVIAKRRSRGLEASGTMRLRRDSLQDSATRLSVAQEQLSNGMRSRRNKSNCALAPTPFEPSRELVGVNCDESNEAL